MNNPAVAIEICEAFLARYLEGFQGYPRTPGGVRRFAEAFQFNVVSVEHLESTLKVFDEGFPTVKQIHDVAWNLRPQFELQEDTFAELKRKYGVPQPFNIPNDQLACHWRAFRDALYYTEGPGHSSDRSFWEASLARDLNPKWDHKESIAWVRAYCLSVGWDAARKQDLTPAGMPYKDPRERQNTGKVFQQIAAPITQADLQRAIEQRKTTSQVDAELDSWSDPDR